MNLLTNFLSLANLDTSFPRLRDALMSRNPLVELLPNFPDIQCFSVDTARSTRGRNRNGTCGCATSKGRLRSGHEVVLENCDVEVALLCWSRGHHRKSADLLHWLWMNAIGSLTSLEASHNPREAGEFEKRDGASVLVCCSGPTCLRRHGLLEHGP